MKLKSSFQSIIIPVFLLGVLFSVLSVPADPADNVYGEFYVQVERISDDGELTDYRITVHSLESAPPTVISIDLRGGGSGYSRKVLDPAGSVSWKVSVFSGGGSATVKCSYTGKSLTIHLPGVREAHQEEFLKPGIPDVIEETGQEQSGRTLEGRWESIGNWKGADGSVIEIRGSKGVFSALGQHWQKFADAGFVSVGGALLKDIMQTRDNEWSCSILFWALSVGVTPHYVYWSDEATIKFGIMDVVNNHFEFDASGDDIMVAGTGTTPESCTACRGIEGPCLFGGSRRSGASVFRRITEDVESSAAPRREILRIVPNQVEEVSAELMKPDISAVKDISFFFADALLANRIIDFIANRVYQVDIFGGRSPLDASGKPVYPEALNSISGPIIEANPGVDWALEMESAYSAAVKFVRLFSELEGRLFAGPYGGMELTDAGKFLETLLKEPAVDAGLTARERGIVQTEILMLSQRIENARELLFENLASQEFVVSKYNARYGWQRDFHVNILKTISAEEWDKTAAEGGNPYLVAHQRYYAKSRDIYVDDWKWIGGDEWDALVRAGRSPVEIVNKRREMDRVIKLVSDTLGEEAVKMLEAELGLDFEAADRLRGDLKELGADPERAEEMVRATQMLRAIVHFGQDHAFADPGAMEIIMRFVDSWCRRSQAMDTMSRHLHDNLKHLSEKQLELIQRADRQGLIEALQITDDLVDESIVELVLMYAEDRIEDAVKENVQKGWWPF